VRLLVAVNARARKGADARGVLDALRRAGCDADAAPPDAEQLAARAAADGGFAGIVVAGGDGTLISTVPALLKTSLPLGIIPLGTFNDLARTLGIPLDVDQAARIVAAGTTRAIDVGRVNGFYFFNEASIGLATRIARRQTPELKRRYGVLAIVGTTLLALRYGRRFHATVRFDGTAERMKPIQLTIANSGHFGGLITNPHATLDDGRLDLYSFEPKDLRDALRLVPKLLHREIAEMPGLRLRRATRFVVETRHPHHVFTDGEPACKTPATFEVLPAAVRVFVPRS